MSDQKQETLQKLQDLLMSGNTMDVEKGVHEFLENNVDDEAGLRLLGNSLLRQDKLDEAIEVFENMVKKHPFSAQSRADLGFAYKQLGDIEKALDCFKKIEPRYSQVWHIIGNILMEKGEKEEARICYKKSVETDPFQVDVKRMLAAMTEEDFAQAEKVSSQILDKHSNHPQALAVMIHIATQAEAYRDAAIMLRQGLNYSPYNANFWQMLTGVCAILGDHQGRVTAAQKTVELYPENVQAQILLATAYAYTNQFEKALEAVEKVLEIDANNAYAHLQRGHILKTVGRREEAENSYRTCLKHHTLNGTAFWALADLKDVKFSTDDMKEMKCILVAPKYPSAQKSQVAFALGKYYEDLSDYKKAFEYYSKGNDIRPDVKFDKENFSDSITELLNAHSSNILQKQSSRNLSPTPIFIVGLPRSGTTLVEQILASHSKVEATCELTNLPAIAREMGAGGRRGNLDGKQSLKKYDEMSLNEFGQNFLDATAIFRTDKPYFIDKLPTNFHLVGTIHMILPDAKIIDVRRHPLDVGFSNFKQHFSGGHEFSYDLENIGHYYNGYLRIMDHWDNLLPGKVHCLNYEKLVRDPDREIRTLLAHCELEFEESCLNFHKNCRPVSTPSSEQVRQPIHSKNVSYWCNFENELKPLIDALGAVTLDRFNGASKGN